MRLRDFEIGRLARSKSIQGEFSMFRITRTLQVIVLLLAFTATGWTSPITFNPNFVVTESRTIGAVRYDVGYVGSGSSRVATYATTQGGVTTYHNPIVLNQGTIPPSFTFITGIDAAGNISVQASYGGGVPVAVRLNVNTPGSSSVSNLFANGIAGGVMYGGNGAQPGYVASGTDVFSLLPTAGGDTGGEVRDGRQLNNGSTSLVGGGSVGSGFGLMNWVNGSLNQYYDLGSTFGFASNLDPTGSLALASYGNEQLGLWNIGANLFTPIAGIKGRPAGVLTGTSNTVFYQNSADNYRLWTWNGGLGINGRTGDVCASNPTLQCGPFGSILLSMGKLNAADLAMINAAFQGSSYGENIQNPGAPGTSSVPEPATSALLGASLLLLLSAAKSKHRSKRGSSITQI